MFIHRESAMALVHELRAEVAESDNRKHVTTIRLLVKSIPAHMLHLKAGSYGILRERVPPAPTGRSNAGMYFDHRETWGRALELDR